MQLIVNQNGNELEVLTKEATQNATSVVAAIAYATDDKTLLDICFKKRTPLRLYARYDSSGPVSDVVSQWFLSKNMDYELLLVPDIFHPKVIWWREVGAYIGSANLTKRAWSGNIEAGIFLTEQELIDNGIADELDEFFEQIHERATPLNRRYAEEMAEARRRMGEVQAPVEKLFDEQRSLPRLQSLVSITRVPNRDRRKTEFLGEWNETLDYLRNISTRLGEEGNRPKWVPENASDGVLVDQFLHALYYSRVRDGQSYPYPEWHLRNKEAKEKAVSEAITWWANLPAAPNNEDTYIKVWAPFVRQKLDRKTLPHLSEDEFVELCKHIHAIGEHARQLGHETFGLKHKLPSMTRAERTEYFAHWLYKQRSKTGRSPLELFHHVLYGGTRDNAPHRLFDACHDLEWKIPHISVSTLGEVIGWAMPEFFPPRNGRTSKALYALGFKVKIHA